MHQGQDDQSVAADDVVVSSVEERNDEWACCGGVAIREYIIWKFIQIQQET